MLKETNKNYRQYITSYVSGFIRLFVYLIVFIVGVYCSGWMIAHMLLQSHERQIDEWISSELQH